MYEKHYRKKKGGSRDCPQGVDLVLEFKQKGSLALVFDFVSNSTLLHSLTGEDGWQFTDIHRNIERKKGA
ncbi:MAG: hypothetical protein HQL89_18255 [Magnetococcales bacterium]|nr:hypothetical protein [Magnetococcales bacterium]